MHEAHLQTAHLSDLPALADLFAACGQAPPTDEPMFSVMHVQGCAYAALHPNKDMTRITVQIVVHPQMIADGLYGVLLGWAEDCTHDEMLDLAPPADRVVLTAWVSPGEARHYRVAGYDDVLQTGNTTLFVKELRAGNDTTE